MVTCRYNVPVVSPGKTKSEKLTKQNKTKQNGFYDINIEGQAQPPRHRPYDKHLRKQVVHLYFVSGVKCSAIARWFSGRPCRKTVQRIIQDYRVHRAVRVPQEGLSPLPQKA